MQRHAFNGRTQPLTCLYAWVALLTTILDFMFYGSCNRTTWLLCGNEQLYQSYQMGKVWFLSFADSPQTIVCFLSYDVLILRTLAVVQSLLTHG